MPIGAFRLNSISRAASAVANSVTATGGTISYYDSGTTFYKVHTFTTTGSNSFTVSSVTGTPTADILLVGGGGAGGGVTTTAGAGGGGGGGAVVNQTGISVTAQTYTISVGAGGTGVSAANGGAGTQSTGLGYTAAGGGAGTVNSAATNGGGSGSNSTTSHVSTAGTYAYKGGNAFGSATTTSRAGGGGAGSSGAGIDAASTVGGNGGPPTQNNIDGENLYYASGGGGSGTTVGNAYNATTGLSSSFAANGAGRNTSGAGNSNTAGTYGGGGGGARNTSTTAAAGGDGRQGIAIIRYPIESVSSISYVNSVNAAAATSVTFPTIQAGDIAVYFNMAYNTTTALPSTVTPTGFTNISSNNISSTQGMRMTSFYKVCTGSESGTSISGMTGTGTNRIILIIYRPNIAINKLTISTPVAATSDNTISGQVLSMAGLTGPFIGFNYAVTTISNGYQSSTVTPTRQVGSNIGTLDTFEATSSSVSFADSTMGRIDGGTNGLVSFTIQVR